MARKYLLLITVCLGTVLTAYVSSCVNIGLPNIMAALNFNLDSVVWVSLSYMLPYGALLPLTGKFGDEFGAKKLYIIGLLLFTIASLFCGMSASATFMIVSRVIQGIGASMILPNAMAIVAATFPVEQRGQALGIWGAMAAAGSAMGPTIGGYLIDHINWQSIFFSITPLSIIGLLMAFFLIPSTKASVKTKIDYVGAILLTVCLALLLLALNQGQKEGWDSLYIRVLFYLSFSSFICFILVEKYVESPIVDLTLFANFGFSIANILNFICYMAFYCAMFLLPFFLKNILNYSPVYAGIELLPLTTAVIIFAPVGGKMSDLLGNRIPTFLGMIVIALSLYMFSFINPHYGHKEFFIRLLIMGIGLGLMMSPLSSSAISILSRDKVGVGSGVFNLFKNIGSCIGVVFPETLLINREVFHQQNLSEYINPNMHAEDHIYKLLQSLWGAQGMDAGQITKATMGLFTGEGFPRPEQYSAFKLILAQLTACNAAVLSFQDVFFIMSLIALGMGFLSMLLPSKAGV